MGRWGYFFAGFISAAALLAAVGLLFQAPTSKRVYYELQPAYNELLDRINDGSIASASIRGNAVIAKPKAGPIFQVWVFSPEKIAEKMVERGIKVYTAGEEASPPTLLGVFINWLPLIVFVLAMGVPLYGIRATLGRLEQAAKKE